MLDSIYDLLLVGDEKISVVGLGYVGLPIALSFAEKFKVIGFDVNSQKISLYKNGIDPTREIGDDAVKNSCVEFTCDEKKLSEAKFHVVAVPTPVNKNHSPDLSFVENACTVLGRNLTKNSVVVFESTVYPGVTEEICAPILEKESHLTCGTDFKIAYSPERLNPGDKVHTIETIKKIVSGMDDETLDCVAKVYGEIIKAGIYRAKSIRIAEAAKVIENSQRDINIAFMNELSIIFNKMSIDLKSVLEAACTKWNFMNFRPGLVGGHCVGVDPYYLVYKAETMEYHSQVILAGRRINDGMGKYIAENCVKKIISTGKTVKNAKVAILGFTFKENCADIRNTKVFDIVQELAEYGISPLVYDPIIDVAEARKSYDVNFIASEDICGVDAVILAVAHDKFCALKISDVEKFFANGRKILLDVKGIFNRNEYESAGYVYWRL